MDDVGLDAGAAGGSAGTSGGDAGVDKPTDAGTGEDHPATTDASDGPRSDAVDAIVDVFHPCVNSSSCSDPTKPACQVDAGVCVGCVQNSDCKAAGAHACDTTMNKCVECVVNGDCTTPSKPICDHQTCRSCKVDSECTGIGPSVCMSHLDGRCATDSETVYVSKTGCNDAPDGGVPGTSQTPYCTSQLAIDSTIPPPSPPVDAGSSNADGGADARAADAGTGAAASGKALVVMRGPTAMTDWSFATSNRTITVVGQSGAQISGGARVGIHVGNGTVYVRNLRVTGGNGPTAIVADGGSVHLDRVMVDGNMTGGIFISNATYDITNTVVANNGANISTSGCGSFGGVCILEPTGAAPGRFLNNTVVANDTTGVSCFEAYPLLGSVIVAKPGGSATAVCSPAPCCGAGPISLDASYRLMAGSSCIDRLTADMSSTAYDFDGKPRPIGSSSDCGAFEYGTPTP